MTGIALRALTAMLFVGWAAADPDGGRHADAVVEELQHELKASRPALPGDEFVRVHTRIVELVGELRTVSPNDPRVAERLPDRWLSLALLGKRDQARAEIVEALATTADPKLRIDGLYFGTLLSMEKALDSSAAVSLAESFIRQAPGDPRASEVLYLAANRLDLAWFVRLGVLAALAVAGGLILLISRERLAVLLRRLRKPAHWLGLIISVAVIVGLLAFHLQPGPRKEKLIARLLGTADAASSRMSETLEFPMRFVAYYAGPVLRELWTVPAGVAVTLSAVAASAGYAVRRRRAPDDDRRPKGVRPWALGFVAALAAFGLADTAATGLKRASLRNTILTSYPDSFRGRLLQGERRQRTMLGEPFELAFDDAVTGRHISMDDLRGKVVVVIFWATWCGPCIGEVPELKRLYAEYRDRGVEFIGISLDLPEDDGGLASLRSFVAEEQIDWPQYYLARDNSRFLAGEPMDDFAESWGINGIPALFVIDAEGRLHSTDARGKLHSLIPSLLRESPAPHGR